MARLPDSRAARAVAATHPAHGALSIGLIGSGRAAGALGRSLRRAGHDVLVARRGDSAAALAETLGAEMADAAEVLTSAGVTILAVPDAAIAKVATELAGEVADGGGRLVVHLAGSLGAAVLDPLHQQGFQTAAIHPLQVLSGWRIAAGTAFAVEADSGAAVLANRIVHDLGGVPIAVAPSGRSAYHAAAVIAANLGMTLLAEAVDLLEQQGIPRGEALQGLGNLVRGGLEASMDRGLPAALTGPIARGDVATVAGHLEALVEDPDLRRAYAAASLLTLRQVTRDDRPSDPAAADAMRALLEGAR